MRLVDIPPGKIASIVTYLEMCERVTASAQNWPEGFALEALTDGDVPRYRQLFRRVGAPWLWFSRLAINEKELSGIISNPNVHIWALRKDNEDAGILELDARNSGEVEIAFLGVVSELIGAGIGRALLSEAINRAWSFTPQRIFVHTCTHDHPRSLHVYQKAGFKAYARKIEIADDPRITGLLPRDAAPHIPMIAA